MKRFLTIIILILIGAAGGWFMRPVAVQLMSAMPAAKSDGQKILYYQSAMHPWVKSDKPGRCTICGMELVPVYEGQKGFEVGGDVVTLNQTMIQVLHVQTAEVKQGPLVKTLQVAGMVDDNAAQHRVLSAYIDGRVDTLHVNYVGAEVAAGQPLADFYSPTLLQAEREYRQLAGELRNSTALRLRQMGLTPEQIAALALKPADALTSQILSPIGGTVVARYVYAGQYVKEGDKLFELADFSTMWFIFSAYEQDLSWLKLGQEVIVTTPAVPGKTFAGKVAFIDPTLDEATRSAKVRVELSNPLENGHRHLLHKLYADGAVKLDTPAVLAVPRTAVIEIGPEAVVYVDQGSGAYARKRVKTGRRGDTLIEILSGVKEGDKVATSGNLLMDGQAEMNRAYAEPVDKEMGNPITDTQAKTMREFVSVADSMAAALAADDLTAFTKANEPVAEITDKLILAFKNRTESAAALEKLASAKPSKPFADIKVARKAFHAFTVAATEVLEPLRMIAGAPEFKVWECSMVSQVIRGAPMKAHWVQVNGRAPQNPFFGSDMIDCAVEIQAKGAKP